MDDFLPLEGIDHLEFYVGNARQAAHFFQTALGFQLFAHAGPSTGVSDKVSYALRQGDIVLVLTTPLMPTSELAAHIHMHGDGVKSIALEVEDAAASFAIAFMGGARAYMVPQRFSDEYGDVIMAAIHAYGDTMHYFVERKHYKGPFLPNFQAWEGEFKTESTDLKGIDHIMGNVGWSEMSYWCRFYCDHLGFNDHPPFDGSETEGRKSILISKDTPNRGRIRLPITEPASGEQKTRVEQFLDFYKGPGIQHIALATDDIISTVKKLKARGVYFQHVQDRPNQEILKRLAPDHEKIAIIDKLGIMLDQDAESYLLQIFTEPIEDRPTLCFEIIQRLHTPEALDASLQQLLAEVEQERQ